MDKPIILSIDTSCDETSAAVTSGRLVLSNVISSQISIHQKYGGVYPALAKRAHQERIDYVVQKAIQNAKKNRFDAVAVTQGPGLAIALEVGIKKAKQISENPLAIRENHRLPLIAVNHLEGHIYSCLAQSVGGLPKREIIFPALCLVVSGGHTELVLMKNHGEYQLIGETLDDACGEALDKAAMILKLGYPGGPVIEKLASKGEALRSYILNQPLKDKKNLNFSYSGLKTQFLYLIQSLSQKEFSQNLQNLALSFQTACFEQITRKTSQAIRVYQPKMILCGGGVISNKTLRKLLRQTAKNNNLPVFFPPKKNLITDNAAMIGVAAYYKYLRGEFVKNIDLLDREPRMTLDSHKLQADSR